MKGIKDVGKKLKNKLSLDDYKISSEEEKTQNAKTLKTQNVKKFRTTIYLPEEENHMLNEIYSRRLLANKKKDRSSLMCEALKLLYEKEMF